MVSEDIQARREAYLAIMRDHAAMPHQEIEASVSETQEALLAVLSGASDEEALRKPAPDEWCLRELALHAEFAERLIAKLIHHTARSGTPSAEDFAGAGIGMMPDDDGRSYREILADLRRTNADLLDAVRDLPEEPDRDTKPAHPFFGQLNCLEWAGFQRVHDVDHLQHAQKIIAAYS